MEIDFITFIYKDCYRYAEMLKSIAEKLQSTDNVVNWKCVESVKADRIPKGFEKIAKTEACGHNSYNHSIAVNKAVELATSKYVILADADIAVLYKGWDKLIVDKLESGLSCFGASYHRSAPRYQNFPCIYFMAYRNDHLQNIGLDFRPKISLPKEAVDRLPISNKKDAGYFGLKKGMYIKCDTGWEIARTIKSEGFKGEGMECVHGDSKKSLLPFRNSKQKSFCLKKPTHMAEWHYDGKLFGTHKQACRSHGLDTKWGEHWKDRIELYLEKNYG